MADVRHYDPDEVTEDGVRHFERVLAECQDPEHHHERYRHHRQPEGQQRAAAPTKLEDGPRANEIVSATTLLVARRSPVVTLLTVIAKGFPALGLLMASIIVSVGAVVLPVPSAGAEATVSVPVIVCPTSVGVDLPPSPVADSARVPASAAHLEVYSATSAAIQLLGLRGSYCNASIGADGNSSIIVVPAGGNPQSVRHGGMTAVIYPACVGCMWDLACPFFPALAQAEAKLYGKCPAQPLGQDVHRLSAETVAFYDPPGEHVPSGSDELVPSNSPYPTDGVVVYGNYKYKGATSPMAMGAVCVLPVSEHGMCTAVLDEFLASEARAFSGLG